jgi:two-component system CheB/CheR fusion protein
LQRFFSRTDSQYQISRNIRDMVIFATHNLGKDPPFSRLDLISCRNVLIYMQPQLQKKVLRISHYALNPDGFLVLGTSEGVGDAVDLFSLVDLKLKIFSKKNAPPTAVFDMIFGHQNLAESDRRTPAPRPLVSVQQLADRKVIEKYAPSGVVINESLEVQQFRGRLGAYLDPTPGAATLNLLKLARPELLVEMRETVHRALSENLPASSGKIHIKQGTELRTLMIDALPLQDAAARGKSLLVLFREIAPVPAAVENLDKESADPQLLQLERELFTTAVLQRGAAEHQRGVGDLQGGAAVDQRGAGHGQRRAAKPNDRSQPQHRRSTECSPLGSNAGSDRGDGLADSEVLAGGGEASGADPRRYRPAHRPPQSRHQLA